MIENAVNTFCLSILMLACWFRLNAMQRNAPHCERWGFVLTATGAFSSILATWWMVWNDIHPDTLLNIGLALIAASVVRVDFHEWFSRNRWDGVDRRGGTKFDGTLGEL